MVNPGICPGKFTPVKGEQYNKPIKQTNKSLGTNSKCQIVVDATERVARVTFSQPSLLKNPTLGVMVPGYVMGQPITVPQGEVRTITIFNGASGGSSYFDVTFSGATSLAASAAAASLLVSA